ncbi:MAG: membrane protein insertase YidC [Chitinophagales bacterium]
MNRDTLIGTALISILLFWYLSNSAKNNAQLDEEKAKTEQVVKQENKQSKETEVLIENLNPEIADSATLSKAEQKAKIKYGAFYKNISGKEEFTSLENDLIRVEFSNKGGQITKVNLKEFKTWDKQDLILVDNNQNFNFTFETNDGQKIQTKELYHSISKIGENSVSMKIDAGNGKYVEKIYSLADNSYFVDFDFNFVKLDDIINPSADNFKATWDFDVIPQEKGLTVERQKSTIYWKQNDEEVDNLSVGTSKDEIIKDSEWIAYKDQFFNATFLTDGLIKEAALTSTFDTEDSTIVAAYNSEIIFDNKNDNYKFQYFFGPNDYKLLKSFDKGQENIVELSTNFFLFGWVKYINKYVIIPIFRLLDGHGLNYGIIIILLTLIIRMALMPLTFKSYVSTAKTKLLKPELDRLKEKYKDDQQKYAAEQMKLYQKSGVSMFGGCLPMLLQMPFFLAMFYFFPSSIELRQESFLWATDLSTYDVLFNLPFNIPVYGAHVSGFTLLMTASSLISARFNPQMQNQNLQPGMEVMKYMPYFFPIFLMVLFNSWSSALTFYYFISNTITLAQQVFINKFMIDEDKLMQQLENNKKKPQKKGGFRTKMEEIYKQQQLEAEKKKPKK